MKRALSLLLFAFLAGCSSFQMSRSEEGVLQNKKLLEDKELSNAHDLLVRGKYVEAHKMFRDFEERYPQSVYFQAARLGEAQSFEGQGKWVEASAIYRDIYLKTKNLQPDIAAMALYRQSFCYEALGDDQKTIATLLDAKNLRTALPKEVGYAEIPARLGATYGRLGREKEAVAYLNEAEKGIAKIRAEDQAALSKDWLAKTYVQMGSTSTNQLSPASFATFVSGQKFVQVYLIKALELNDRVWSPRALKELQGTYQDLYSQVEAVRENRSRQAELGGSLIELIDRAELYRPIAGQTQNNYQIQFFTQLTDVRKNTETLLYQAKETMGLTEESQKLNSIKRPGRIKDDAVKTPPKVVPTEDPNL
ncbi:MAG: hypothetical protein J7501_09685 [Bdellovibrio sp.]|nr:hypothetical protein [Bdellovibrio sp.]